MPRGLDKQSKRAPASASDPPTYRDWNLDAADVQTLKRLLNLEPGGYSAGLIAARSELRRIDERVFRHHMSRRECPASDARAIRGL
jgi:hypothetical protein